MVIWRGLSPAMMAALLVAGAKNRDAAKPPANPPQAAPSPPQPQRPH
ncbi:hypothetical protein [Novispirillum itersonii]|uniref:Uncharacterized protein n=1 Tax=Novispirillum itersonii TaxID=189 RepID=A0A7W9ZE90_NOVIT|nr:hypothetical protein [Novispirillum itersonii]MBB6209800.1 hypothetical protein [Novispirillum itersonii]